MKEGRKEGRMKVKKGSQGSQGRKEGRKKGRKEVKEGSQERKERR